jgi:hypothetical protein
MTEDKRVLYLDNFEQRVMVRSLNDARTHLMQNEKPTEDVDDLLLKLIDAPTKKAKRRLEREAR